MSRRSISRTLFLLLTVLPAGSNARGDWPRHVIDDSARGADGVRLGDFNGDGLPDVVTGWEESGVVRLYLHPGAESVRSRWTAVTIARARSPEDAVPIDVDRDGRLDIVSCHEGKQRQVLVHWNQVPGDPGAPVRPTDPMRWKTDRFAQLDGAMWMYAAPIELADSTPAIVVGSKGKGASISILVSPSKNPRDLGSWQRIRLRDAGWIMSLRVIDMDGDGDLDVVFSDRKGQGRGAAWLEQPAVATDRWTEHAIGGSEDELMFLSATRARCLVSTRSGIFLDCRRSEDRWSCVRQNNPPSVRFGKAIEPLPGGRILLTANTYASSDPDRPGVWLRDASGSWSVLDSTLRVKFDRMEVLDLDGDGDLDCMTCEERQNLGVVWYENPEIGGLSSRR